MMNHLSSLFERHRLLTSRRLRLNWPRCVPNSTQGNPMAATSTVGALVSSSEELHKVLTMHGYIARRETVKVLYLALRLEKPLLLEGPPGAGKTQIAKVLSAALQMPLIRLQCYDGIDEAKALFQWNEPLQRMALEFVRDREQRETWAELKRQLYGPDFLIAGPILRALQSEARTV